VLANIFLHYALDLWLGREFPDVPFERYADDEILHCRTKQQAEIVRDAIIERLAQVGLELNLDKTRIVYCKDSDRTGSHEHEQFDFLGYTFRPRLARSKTGKKFVSFLPAVSEDAAKGMRRTIKRWRLHLRSGSTLADLAQEINSTVRGWINYYGRFYRTELIQTLKLINQYLMRWAMRKYKRLRGHPTRAARFLTAVAERDRSLFAHWRLVQPTAENAGLIWPQCDGLIWPHLPSERDPRVRAFPSTDRRSRKGCQEWSCSRRFVGIVSSPTCRCMRWRASMGCIGGRSARRWSRRCRRSVSGRRAGRRRRWGRIGSGSIRS
jgi:hypothetical protein